MLNLRVRVCVQARRNASASLESNAVCIGRLNMRTLILLTYLLDSCSCAWFCCLFRFCYPARGIRAGIAGGVAGDWQLPAPLRRRPSPPCWVNFEFWVSVSLLFFCLDAPTPQASKKATNKKTKTKQTRQTRSTQANEANSALQSPKIHKIQHPMQPYSTSTRYALELFKKLKASQ